MGRPPRSPGKLFVVGIGLALVLVHGVALTAAMHSRGIGIADDAFISFRIARNISSGHGLRFNADGPRVEAASNFAFTLMLAALDRAGASMIRSSIVINMAATLLTLILLAWFVRRSVGAWGLWAPFAMAAMTVVCRNVVSGLETCQHGLLLLVGVALYIAAEERPRPSRRLLALSSVAIAFVALSRPEGPMYMIGLGVLRLIDLAGRRARGEPLDLKTEATWAGAFLVIVLPYTVWRALYFGSFLPNTFHAKEIMFGTGANKLGSGVAYFQLMNLHEPLLPLSLLAGTVILIFAPSRRIRTLFTIIVTQSLFMVLSGGDWPHMFGFGRFLYPALPLMLWLLAEAGVMLIRQRRRVLLGTAAAAILVVSQTNLVALLFRHLPAHYHYKSRTPLTRQSVWMAYAKELRRMPLHSWLARSTQSFDMSRYHNNFDAAVGMWLRDRYGKVARIASIQAGQFAFWSEMPFFDLFGLVSPEVTRLKQPSPRDLYRAIREFDPHVIAFYKLGQATHHRLLVLDGCLWEAGYGLRYVFQRERQAFVVFEKGYESSEDPQNILFSSLADLRHRVSRDRWIAAIDSNNLSF